MKALLIFPNQLYVEKHPEYDHIYIEDDAFFNAGIPYHKHKLILHRASMKNHFDQLDSNKIYLEYPITEYEIKDVLSKYEKVYAYDPVNHDVYDKYTFFGVLWLESKNFLTDRQTLLTYFKDKKRFYMYDFYVFQRKRLNILMENGKPIGEKYSFDSENRKKLPKNAIIPSALTFEKSTYVKDASKWVEQTFFDHLGSIDTFNYPTTRLEALNQLRHFVKEKLIFFGPYQDAISQLDPLLYHANISSSLNIGLLSPKEVVDEILKQDVPLSSKEGFIRQIIGWREFVRGVYLIKGKQMKNENTLNHQHQLSEAWFVGTTGIPIVDITIKKFVKHAYLHHIERLMILGNLMLVTHIHPNEVYRYFMILSIDGYDWVMVPNVYGMSQFACGELMTTKPYFSGSNYLLKMGVEKGEWKEIWDALFYMFLQRHKELIEKNPRLQILIKNLERKSKLEIETYQKIKHDFINRVTIKDNHEKT